MTTKPEAAPPAPATDLPSLLDALLDSLVLEGRARGGKRRVLVSDDVLTELRLKHAVSKALAGRKP